jgi:DNA-binding CsgD family transcriptional regulator/tetratricopeptide (TPR) repeat protein
MLSGRPAECATLERLLEATRAGQSAVLVLRGEAGIGKSALLAYAAERAEGCRVVRAVGVESEMELPFASMHQLCAPLLGGLERLPRPQRDALATAAGLSGGDRPDRFLVGLAVLSLLSDAAEAQPLVALIDDAQWLDRSSAQVLAFVARRLEAESVLFLFAEREPNEPDELAGLPVLPLEGLSDANARELLDSVISGPLDERVAERFIAETRGNPLALLEVPQGLSTTELAGGFGLSTALPLPGRIEARFRQRVEQLPAESQQLLLVAAAEPLGDPTLLWRAALELGIPREAAEPPQVAGLLVLGTRVTFRHPLLRSAIYRAASSGERRNAHRALAAATDRSADPDRRAWHRSHATLVPDEDVAGELERSAGRAHARGGLAAAAAFLERAAALTVDPARRAGRALAAAQANHQAGAPEVALALLASAQAGPLDQLERAQANVLRAQIAFTSNRGRDAPALLLDAAKQLEPLDVTLARETYLDALAAAQFAGRVTPGAALRVAEAALAAPPSPAPRAPDLLLDAMVVMITEGHASAAPLLRQAVDAFRDGDVAANGGFRWLWLAEEAAQELWDHDAWYELAALQLQLVQASGALAVLPLAFTASICARIYAGELTAAASLIEDQQSATDATGSRLAPYGALILTAWRGSEADLSALIDATLADVVLRGEEIAVSTCQWVTAVLHNSLGHYERALSAAEQALDPPRKLDWTINATLPELVEAAARCGQAALAQDALNKLSTLTRPSRTDWGLGLEARCRAQLSEHAIAEDLYREAIDRFGRTRVRGEHARAHLLYGEWLRREGRRVDAREHLRTAHGLFTAMSAKGFAERARRELLATGETVRKRIDETRGELTAQEGQIARLAGEGHSNPEIGAQLFISPRTVEYHLHKVFTKLEISSRNELQRVLPSEAREAQPV